MDFQSLIIETELTGGVIIWYKQVKFFSIAVKNNISLYILAKIEV